MSELQQGRGACHIKGRRRNICNLQPMSEGICDQLDDIAGGSSRKAKTKNLEYMVTDRIEGRKSLHWTEWIADISASSPSFFRRSKDGCKEILGGCSTPSEKARA